MEVTLYYSVGGGGEDGGNMTHQSRPSEILKTSWSKLRVSVIPLKGKISVLDLW